MGLTLMPDMVADNNGFPLACVDNPVSWAGMKAESTSCNVGGNAARGAVTVGLSVGPWKVEWDKRLRHDTRNRECDSKVKPAKESL